MKTVCRFTPTRPDLNAVDVHHRRQIVVLQDGFLLRDQPRLAFAAQLVISVAKEDVGSLVVRIEYVAGPAGTQPHGGFSFRSCEEHVADDVRGAAKRHGGGRASRAGAHDAVLEAGAVGLVDWGN